MKKFLTESILYSGLIIFGVSILIHAFQVETIPYPSRYFYDVAVKSDNPSGFWFGVCIWFIATLVISSLFWGSVKKIGSHNRDSM